MTRYPGIDNAILKYDLDKHGVREELDALKIEGDDLPCSCGFPFASYGPKRNLCEKCWAARLTRSNKEVTDA